MWGGYVSSAQELSFSVTLPMGLSRKRKSPRGSLGVSYHAYHGAKSRIMGAFIGDMRKYMRAAGLT